MPRKQKPEEAISTQAPARRPTVRRAKHSPAAKPATAKSVPAGVKKSPLAAVAMAQPSQEEIARLAYSFWLERGGAHGSAEEDWLRAERQIAARYFSAA